MTSSDDSPAYVPGPLDELVPGLRAKSERLPALPVHPRVVRAQRDDGSYALVLVSFAPPANVRAFHAALKPLVEATLLVELSRPPRAVKGESTRLTSLELLLFYEPPFELAPALVPFAFERADVSAPAASKALSLARRERQLIDGTAGDEPLVRFSAHVAHPSEVRAKQLEAALRDRASDAVFGESPGVQARALAECAQSIGIEVAPTRAGIEAIEALVVQETTGVVRFMSPLVYQGLCDLIGVTAHELGTEVEWGVCEPDEAGIAPPPLLRATDGENAWHVPIGEHVLRWCVMPLAPGEVVPTLGAWAEHEFT
jgi:hypothetical protein